MIWLEIYLGIGILIYVLAMLLVAWDARQIPDIYSLLYNAMMFILIWPIMLFLIAKEVINDFRYR